MAVATQSIQQLAYRVLVCLEHINAKVWNMVVSQETSTKEGGV